MDYSLYLTSIIFSVTLAQHLLFLQGSVVLVVFIIILITSRGAMNQDRIHARVY